MVFISSITNNFSDFGNTLYDIFSFNCTKSWRMHCSYMKKLTIKKNICSKLKIYNTKILVNLSIVQHAWIYNNIVKRHEWHYYKENNLERWLCPSSSISEHLYPLVESIFEKKKHTSAAWKFSNAIRPVWHIMHSRIMGHTFFELSITSPTLLTDL